MNPADLLEREVVQYIRIPPAGLYTTGQLATTFDVATDEMERALRVLTGLGVMVAVGTGDRPRYALRWGATAPWETPRPRHNATEAGR